MARKPIILAWEPSPEVERIRTEITRALMAMGPLKQIDVVAALFFLILASLMEATIDEATEIANTPLLEVASEAFAHSGCGHSQFSGDPGVSDRKH